MGPASEMIGGRLQGLERSPDGVIVTAKGFASALQGEQLIGEQPQGLEHGDRRRPIANSNIGAPDHPNVMCGPAWLSSCRWRTD